jgi:hypothetical protein
MLCFGKHITLRGLMPATVRRNKAKAKKTKKPRTLQRSAS